MLNETRLWIYLIWFCFIIMKPSINSMLFGKRASFQHGTTVPLVERRIVFLGSLSSKQAQQFNSKLRLVNNYICAITRLFRLNTNCVRSYSLTWWIRKPVLDWSEQSQSGLAMKTARESADDEVKTPPKWAPCWILTKKWAYGFVSPSIFLYGT